MDHEEFMPTEKWIICKERPKKIDDILMSTAMDSGIVEMVVISNGSKKLDLSTNSVILVDPKGIRKFVDNYGSVKCYFIHEDAVFGILKSN